MSSNIKTVMKNNEIVLPHKEQAFEQTYELDKVVEPTVLLDKEPSIQLLWQPVHLKRY